MFPTTPSLGADRKRRPAALCIPENHNDADAAKVRSGISGGNPSGTENAVDVSRGTPSDADGAACDSHGAVGKGKSFHTVADIALMQMMRAARMARPDILRALSFLARCLTKWDEDCSKRLRRLMSYVDSTVTFRMHAWRGSPHRSYLEGLI